MKRGLVIGKFMPLHRGHIGLVRFAAAHCDELIVSMSYTDADPIPGPLRFEWVKEEFRIYPKIKAEISLDDFDDDTMTWPARMTRWAEFVQKRFPPIDILFSSEAYGPMLAAALKVTHLAFDPDRTDFPVSATQIRANPWLHWDQIAVPARPYFARKACFYGPESTGKSTMAKNLAAHYKTEYVPEVAKEFITSNNFTAEDIIRIGEAQNRRVLEKLKSTNRVLFCDTDLITTAIYSRQYLGVVPPVIAELEKRIRYDQYFFFDIDVPWVADGLRDLGDRREEMRDIFWNELKVRGIKPILLKGDYRKREQAIRSWADRFFPDSVD